MLGREPAPDLHAGRVQPAATDGGVRAGQVDVLEEADLGRRRGEPPRPQAAFVERDELTGLDLADEGRADDVQRGGLARDHPAVSQLPDHKRPEPLRVARCVQGVLVHVDEGVGAADLRKDAGRGLLDSADGLSSARDQLGQHVGVRGRLQPREPALRREQRGELTGIREVAVVPQRDRDRLRRPESRLRVRPHWRASGGVTAVRDGDVAPQSGERRLVEDLGDEPHLLVYDDPPAVADRDAGRFLAAVL